MSSVSTAQSHGELKRRLARLLGTDPSRYADDIGVERHRRLTVEEIDRICAELGLGFVDGTKQTKVDTVMIRLGRDHRTGAEMCDVSDLVAIINAIQEGDDANA